MRAAATVRRFDLLRVAGAAEVHLATVTLPFVTRGLARTGNDEWKSIKNTTSG